MIRVRIARWLRAVADELHPRENARPAPASVKPIAVVAPFAVPPAGGFAISCFFCAGQGGVRVPCAGCGTVGP